MGLFDWLTGQGRRDRFAARVVARLQERNWPHPISYDRDAFALDVGGHAGKVALHGTYAEWSRHPQRGRAETLDDAIGFIFEIGPPPPFEEAKAMLRPVFRSRASLEAAPFDPEDSADLQNAWRPVGDHLAVLVGIDRPHSLTIVDRKTLHGWGRAFEECLDIAAENLRNAPSPQFEQDGSGFHLVDSDDRNPVARLMTPVVFATLQLAGDPVVVAASRRCLLVAGSEDAAALDGLARYAAAVLAEETRPLSYAPMVLRDGRWLAFRPAEGEIACLHAMQRVFDYADQRPRMEIWRRRQGRTEEFADMMTLAVDDDLRTVALWDEAQSLIPRADFVVRRLPDRGCIARHWSDVEKAFGGLEPAGSPYAPYYAARDPLDAEALRRLEAAPDPDWAEGRGIGMTSAGLSIFG